MLAAILAVLSGLLASSSSAWSKFAQQPEFGFFGFKSHFSEHVQFLLQFGIYLLGNAIMWLIFVTAIKKSSKVIIVVILNNMSNLFATAFYGCWLFGERISLTWCLGALLIAIGCTLLHRPSDELRKK
ncbi:expressed protein [Echinococcus multilocularis]|uniref:Expressed protein n=1 Tax=Echinococcus multilocularis TaxID=6211 RepID=A0A068YF46_ECHMU|nr:expressed protein [Echinococcus multilocularis]